MIQRCLLRPLGSGFESFPAGGLGDPRPLPWGAAKNLRAASALVTAAAAELDCGEGRGLPGLSKERCDRPAKNGDEPALTGDEFVGSTVSAEQGTGCGREVRRSL